MVTTNTFAHDRMCTLWEEAAETTSMNMTLSKDLQTYTMGGMANKDRTAGGASNTSFGAPADNPIGDREYIPQEYRFEIKDGIETAEGDGQNIIDRMIPVNRIRSFNVLATIKAKELGDPQRVTKVAQGFARDIANKIDTICYKEMIIRSTMFVGTGAKFTYDAAIDAETLMLNRGLSRFGRKLFLSNKHYAAVAKDLSTAARDVLVTDALSRAKIPNLATFDTMRSDYLISNPAVNASDQGSMSVNGDQEHVVATYGTDGFYKDNREMTLIMKKADFLTPGTKIKISKLNSVHPETREDTGEEMQFTVLAKNSNTSIQITPPIIASGPYQNVVGKALHGTGIDIINKVSDTPSLFYTPESTVIVPGRVPVIGDAIRTTTLTTENGIPMTMLYWYDGHKMQYNMKAVVSMDVQVIYPDMLGGIYRTA